MLRDARPLGLLLALGLLAAGCGSSTPPHPGDGSTVLACGTAADCPSGQVCQGGLCVTAKQCNSDADCPSGETCNLLQGTCNQGNQQADAGSDAGTDAGTDGGNPPPGGSCTTKYDCAAGQICGSDGKCANPPSQCTKDADCPRGKICNFSNQCEPGCSSQQDCDPPMLCHPQKFICDYCSLSNPCPQGQSCVASSGGTALDHPQCETAVTCTTTQDCATNAPGTVCKNGVCANCTAHADCNVAPYNANPGNQTNPNPPICGPNGLCGAAQSSCTDQNCQSQLNNPDAYCDTSQNPPNCGVYQCTKDAECTNSDGSPGTCNLSTHTCATSSSGGDGGTPTGGCTGSALSQCQSQCSQPDPTTGLPGSCNTATCTCAGASGGTGGMCTTDSDCPSTQTCSMGICTDKAVASGGGACDTLTCISGGCVDAADPSTSCSSMGCLLGLLGGGGGGTGSGTACTSDTDCTAPETCQGTILGMCLSSCTCGTSSAVPCE